MSAPACRVCRSEEVEDLGALPDVDYFAGRSVGMPLPGGRLWRCRGCHFVFRHPVLTDDDYARLYREGTAEVWAVSRQDREDFKLVAEYLTRVNGSKGADILDVGCYTGQLLTSLPALYRKYGVEPSVAAARIASERGAVIVADTVRHLGGLTQQFDIITACDVIEHVIDPVAFLATLSDRIRENGRILISTGNADAWLWRVAGSRFWYCYYPEHISFVGPRTLPAVAARCGLELADLISFNYTRWGSLPRVRALAGALLYGASPAVYHFLRGRARDDISQFNPPGCGATRDHLLCVFSKS
jgi:SAM-dependent methyltransferase